MNRHAFARRLDRKKRWQPVYESRELLRTSALGDNFFIHGTRVGPTKKSFYIYKYIDSVTNNYTLRNNLL